MPATNEWSFTSEVATWITQILETRPDLPFKNARVEKPDQYSQKRNDLVIYGRDGKPAISGEMKMPDKANGGTPYNAVVVKDAHDKADHLTVAHFFTWNVNKCVLWNTFEQGVPLMERRIAHYDVLPLPIRKSDDTEQPRVQEQIKRFLVELLERCAAVLSGEKPLELIPPMNCS